MYTFKHQFTPKPRKNAWNVDLLAGLVCQEVLERHQNVGHNIPQAHPFLLSHLDLHALPSVHSNGVMKMFFVILKKI